MAKKGTRVVTKMIPDRIQDYEDILYLFNTLSFGFM